MTLGNNFHLHIVNQERDFDIDFQRREEPSSDTVMINGHHFSMEGESKAIAWIKKKIPELSSKTNITVKQLNQTLSSYGSTEITTEKAHTIGVEKLKQQTDMTPIQMETEKIEKNKMGDVIVLVGTSSAGKTSIISAIREFEPEREELGSDKTGAEYIYEFMEKNYELYGISKEDWEHLHQVLEPKEDNFHIHDAVAADDLCKFRQNVTLEDQERARKTASLLRKPVQELLKTMPHIDEIVMDKILDHSQEGTNTVFDILDVDKVHNHSIGNQTNVKSVLVYCPFHNLTKRLAKRNQKAIESGNFENVRAGVFPLFQFAELFGPRKAEDKKEDVIDTVSRKIVEDDFDSNFDAWVEDMERRDPIKLKNQQEDGSLDAKRKKEKRELLEAFGFTEMDPSHKTVELTPRKEYKFRINTSDPSLGKSIAEKGKTAAKIILGI